VTEAEFDRVMAVNVKSIYHSIPVIVPAFKSRGGGSIINIASIGAMRPRPGLVWYNASKAAVANVGISLSLFLIATLNRVPEEPTLKLEKRFASSTLKKPCG